MTRNVPDWLYPSAGDEFQTRWIREFSQLIEERTYLPGHNCLFHYIPGYGVVIEAMEQRADFRSVWHTVISDQAARVGAGRCNTALPWLADDSGPLRPLDGLDEKGEPHKAGAPLLKLSATLFDEEGYSWIVARVKIDPATGKMLAPKEGGLTVAQTNVVTWGDGGSVDVDGAGDFPVAMLRRPAAEKESFGTVTMNAYFNLQHRFVGGEEGQKGCHQFWI